MLGKRLNKRIPVVIIGDFTRNAKREIKTECTLTAITDELS